MTSLAESVVSFIFTCVFYFGCLSFGYLVFGNMLNILSRRNKYILLNGKKIKTNKESALKLPIDERISAPHLQLLQTVVLTMDSIQVCTESLSENSKHLLEEIDKELK